MFLFDGLVSYSSNTGMHAVYALVFLAAVPCAGVIPAGTTASTTADRFLRETSVAIRRSRSASIRATTSAADEDAAFAGELTGDDAAEVASGGSYQVEQQPSSAFDSSDCSPNVQ